MISPTSLARSRRKHWIAASCPHRLKRWFTSWLFVSPSMCTSRGGTRTSPRLHGGSSGEGSIIHTLPHHHAQLGSTSSAFYSGQSSSSHSTKRPLPSAGKQKKMKGGKEPSKHRKTSLFLSQMQLRKILIWMWMIVSCEVLWSNIGRASWREHSFPLPIHPCMPVDFNKVLLSNCVDPLRN